MSAAVQPSFAAARAGRALATVLLFQGAWFACVLGAARGHALWGVAAVALAVAVLLVASRRRGADLRLVAAALATGLVWDSALAHAGLVVYASPGPWSGAAPAWILALWALWGVVLREPLRWLHGRPLVSMLLGGIGGAASYEAAARLGACRFDDAPTAWAVLAAGWALITPLQLALARRLDREATR